MFRRTAIVTISAVGMAITPFAYLTAQPKVVPDVWAEEQVAKIVKATMPGSSAHPEDFLENIAPDTTLVQGEAVDIPLYLYFGDLPDDQPFSVETIKRLFDIELPRGVELFSYPQSQMIWAKGVVEDAQPKPIRVAPKRLLVHPHINNHVKSVWYTHSQVGGNSTDDTLSLDTPDDGATIEPGDEVNDMSTELPNDGAWEDDPDPIETGPPSPSYPVPSPSSVPPKPVPGPPVPVPTEGPPTSNPVPIPEPSDPAPKPPPEPVQAPTPIPDHVFNTLRGETRHETSTKVMTAMLGEQRHTRIFLARDDNNVDALLSLPSAVSKDIPVVQTASSVLTPITEQFIANHLEPDGDVIILGGHVAIEPQVQRVLLDKGYRVTRLGGPSRVETAKELAAWSGMEVQQAPGLELDDHTVLTAMLDQRSIVFHEGPLTTRRVKTVVEYQPGDRVAALFYTGMRDRDK